MDPKVLGVKLLQDESRLSLIRYKNDAPELSYLCLRIDDVAGPVIETQPVAGKYLSEAHFRELYGAIHNFLQYENVAAALEVVQTAADVQRVTAIEPLSLLVLDMFSKKVRSR
jgi:hypothetical protein